MKKYIILIPMVLFLVKCRQVESPTRDIGSMEAESHRFKLYPKRTPLSFGGRKKIIVNLYTNRLNYFENYSLQGRWNLGTGKGAIGGNRSLEKRTADDTTPTGNFFVQYIEHCPKWENPREDRVVPGCSSQNPLGVVFMKFGWDEGDYGLHGTMYPELLKNGTTSEKRRLSWGCIRNTNENAKWLSEQVELDNKEYFDSDKQIQYIKEKIPVEIGWFVDLHDTDETIEPGTKKSPYFGTIHFSKWENTSEKNVLFSISSMNADSIEIQLKRSTTTLFKDTFSNSKRARFSYLFRNSGIHEILATAIKDGKQVAKQRFIFNVSETVILK